MSSATWHDPGTDKTFHFDEHGMFVSEDGLGPQKGFKDDDEFSNWVHSYVIEEMKKLGLVEKCHPENGAPIYHTQNAFNSPEKLLILIQGTGRVRAGVWSVGVCAYAGLNAGSVLPDIIEAKKRNMEVIVLNPNDPRYSMFIERYKSNIGMVRHTLAIFEDLIIKGNPKRIYILCHSMGGECAIACLRKFPEWMLQHCRAIAMTDACESRVDIEGLKINTWCMKHIINWICSEEEANIKLPDGISSQHYSAGTKDHPLSTAKAWPFIWSFFD
ncbi:hypothetical protein TVAG_340670 [Trichomonas vaginalis G3]|uniref:Arb2 domain-containing protein n=1 Tax=Trichomonas vaginalis (strain ATCC PRA-98 / G3) TaxID=412133 RepID=A2DTM6_TRIV3|nr:FAM172 family protein-like protein CG10038 family [Trichomonas vaginalis G3]EAY16173.1 hypothetical protein TVAG_340670 [Trichomonas vaginalis G3]KAI5493336.1 FAM172 family protein-like protein CG10038 family [Trichomonas vaginalis G3]|eukprot:XP_001328396.1 hypothetical protein [Trichomonas vaginalis G3]